MGAAFGSAAMVGVAAVVLEGRTEAVVLLACLLILALLLPSPTRVLTLAASLGIVVGFAGATFQHQKSSELVAPDVAGRLEGVIASDPRLSSRGSTVLLEWEDANSVTHESLVFYTGIDAVGRGDTVEVEGRWADESASVLFAERIEIVDAATGAEMRRRSLRTTARRRLLERVGGSNGSLALGLLIGDDSGLTEGERDRLRASGLTHITAVSGSNVALVIAAVAFLLRALNRIGWVWFGIQLASIIFYVWIVGTDPPIVRAAIMGSLVLLAGVIGRPTHLLTLLALAGAAMCIHDPEVLTALGFQLSFLSMIGLGLAGDLISRAEGTRRKVAAALISPTGAALLTAPLLAARFGTFSIGTIPANVVVAPVIVPATMLSGVVAIIPDGFLTGSLAGGLVWVLTGFVLLVSNGVGGTDLSLVNFTPLTTAQTVALYLVLALSVVPLMPEVRITFHKVRLWMVAEPPRATVVSALFATVLVSVALLID